MVTSTARFGNLGKVFKNGESDLLNEVARLTILYEDLRLELEELRLIQERRERDGTKDSDDYRVAYFVRRSIVTLVEFRRVLTAIRMTSEFKRELAKFPKIEAEELLPAEHYFQQNGDRIKALRNEFGGHIQASAVQFATKHLSDSIGRISVSRSCNGWSLGLECDFAAHLIAGVIVSKLGDCGDYKRELQEAFTLIARCFNHVQAVTSALVFMFLWERFGH